MHEKLKTIETGFTVTVEEEEKDSGTVRQVAPGGRDEIIVYIQNEGNFIVPAQAVRSAQDGKVVLARAELDERVRNALEARASGPESVRPPPRGRLHKLSDIRPKIAARLDKKRQIPIGADKFVHFTPLHSTKSLETTLVRRVASSLPSLAGTWLLSAFGCVS
jgi:hypothetical protein